MAVALIRGRSSCLTAGLGQVAGDLAGELLGVVAELRRQVLVEAQGRQSMDQCPCSHASGQGVRVRLQRAGEGTVQRAGVGSPWRTSRLAAILPLTR
jgi:hypothetical protein